MNFDSLIENFNLDELKKNQNVSVSYFDDYILFESQQKKSTPGIFFGPMTLEAGDYLLEVSAETTADRFAFPWIYNTETKKRLIRDTHFVANQNEVKECSFSLRSPTSLNLGVLVHAKSANEKVSVSSIKLFKQEEVEIPTTPAVTAQKLEVKEQPKEAIENVERFMFSPKSTHGHNTYNNNLKKSFNFTIVESESEVEDLLRSEKPVFFNGYTNRNRRIAHVNPKFAHIIWHSTFRGSQMMGEFSRLENLMNDTLDLGVNAYLLSSHDSLPLNWTRITTPLSLVDEPCSFNKKSNFDVFVGFGSPYSDICKNGLDLIIKLICEDIHFGVLDYVNDKFNIENLISKFNPSATFTVIKATSPLPLDFYTQFKVYCLFSVTDTRPYTFVESVSSGTPTVITDQVGWANICPELSVSSLNVSDFVSKIKRLLNSDPLRLSVWKGQLTAILEYEKSSHSYLSSLLSQIYKPKGFENRKLTSSKKDRDTLRFLIEEFNSVFYKGSDFFLDDTSKLQLSFSVFSEETDIQLVENSTYALKEKDWCFLHDFPAPELIDLSLDSCFKGKDFCFIIDRDDWAFNNISDEICSRYQDSVILTIDMLNYLQRNKINIQESMVVVCFWYGSLEVAQSVFSNSKTLTMIYDHYSWRADDAHQAAFNKAVSLTDHIGVGNDKLLREIGSATDFKKPIHVLKDGVSFTKFPLLENKPRNVFTLGWIGNSKQNKEIKHADDDLKGLSLLIDFVNQIQDDDITLHIQDVSKSGFISHSELSQNFYSKIDCLVCMSSNEGTPNPVFEALSSGIPVLTTRVGNTGDILIEGLNGFFINRTFESFSENLEDLMTTSFKPEIIRNSVSSFSWDRKTQNWLNVLSEIKKEIEC